MDHAEASLPHPHGELSPLLLSTGDHEDDSVDTESHRSVNGDASVLQTVINVSKTCMGTGTLALPYASRQAGIVLNIVGMLAIVAWNVFSIERLCRCLDLLPRKHESRQGTITLSRVAFCAFGTKGMHAVDSMFMILLLGVIVAYEDAILCFLRDTPFTTGSAEFNALVTAIVIGVLSTVPDMGHLSKVSAAGLTVLFLTFLVIAFYGNYTGLAFNLWPQNGMEGVSHWFGCVVFGFGSVPLTYNIRSSMKEPQFILMANCIGLIGTAIAYIMIGNGVLLLYPEIEGDILHELPVSGALPTLVRIAMIVVVLTTAPLLVVPCGELVEEKLFVDAPVPLIARIVIRLGICVLCTCVSIFVSGFVNVLSFVGCCCVSVVSFVIPPLLHIYLSIPAMNYIATHEHPSPPLRTTLWLDILMLLWGGAATLCSSVYTFRVLVDVP